MTRIAFFTERLLLGFGVDLVVDQLASGLADRGHEVTVYCVLSQGDYVDRPYDIRRLPVPNSSYGFLTDRNAVRIAASQGWWRGCHDVFIVNTPPFFALLPMLPGARIAVDHGVSPRSGRPLREQVDAAATRWLQQQRYFPTAERVIAISEFIARTLPEGLQSRTTVVGHGAEHYGRPADFVGRELRKKLDIPDDDVLALYVGRLNPELQPYKGVRTLSAAMSAGSLGPCTRLVMAGYGDKYDADRLRAAHVVPLVRVPAHRMGALYSAADIFVTASEWEGFDLPALEAQYAGLPVVARRVGSHQEVIRDGETGVLCDDTESLLSAIRDLADDRHRRQLLGSNALRWASKFTWSEAVDRYDEIINDVVELRPVIQPKREKISALVLNYGSSEEDLDRTVGSLVSSRSTWLDEIVVVDNASEGHVDAPEIVARRWHQKVDGRDVWFERLDQNFGFAGGINRGMELCRNEWIFLLNSDAEVHPDAVELCADVLAEQPPACVAVAPKILLSNHPGFIDAVGNAINDRGEAFNIGIGQPDVGQYDRPERCFGPCFAAGLFRKSAFDTGLVGPLDDTYFMYYEDVDWNWRANLLGYSCITAPLAEVYHQHSGSTGQLPFEFKYHLIERNLLCTVAKNFARGHAIRVALSRTRSHLRAVVRSRNRKVHARIVVGFARRLPMTLRARRSIQARRARSDHAIVSFGAHEVPFFDPVGREPVLALEPLTVAYRRLAAVEGDGESRALAAALAELSPVAPRLAPGVVKSRLHKLLLDQPRHVVDFADRYVDSLTIAAGHLVLDRLEDPSLPTG